jgi:hypothetical protein
MRENLPLLSVNLRMERLDRTEKSLPKGTALRLSGLMIFHPYFRRETKPCN